MTAVCIVWADGEPIQGAQEDQMMLGRWPPRRPLTAVRSNLFPPGAGGPQPETLEPSLDGGFAASEVAICFRVHPALIIRLNGEIDTVMAARIDDGLITGLYAVRNPEKLSHMQRQTALHR